jgi:hypothetical protein
MKSTIFFPSMALFTGAVSTLQSNARNWPHDNCHSTPAHPIPTIFLAGDSTEAPGLERKVGVNISNTALISALHSSTTPHSRDEVLEVSPEKDDSRQLQTK